LEFWINPISSSFKGFGHFGIFVRVSSIWLGFYTLKKLDHFLLPIFTNHYFFATIWIFFNE
jgi:hypothetical protein